MMKVFAINPGSSSTKVALFDFGEDPIHPSSMRKEIIHDPEQCKSFLRIIDQYEFRKNDILTFLEEKAVPLSEIDAFAARGGILPPLKSGTYTIDQIMVDYLTHSSPVDHPSNLAAIIAFELMKVYGKPGFTTDPISVDELIPESRVSGMVDIPRKSLLHALNMKAAARKVAVELQKPYQSCNFVIAHLGGGVSIGAQRKGQMIDVNNANDEGPFSPNRTGELPVGDVVRWCYSETSNSRDVKAECTKRGGLIAYTGTHDLRMLLDKKTETPANRQVIEAMAYQIGKEIGGMCAVLHGKLDAIILTGGMAQSMEFVEMIKQYVSTFGLVVVVPGEYELEALAKGAHRVLSGSEETKHMDFSPWVTRAAKPDHRRE